MYSLLKTDKLELTQSDTSAAGNNAEIDLIELAAYACEGEQALLATYAGHYLVLRTIVAKHRQNVSTKTIDWTASGSGRLLALAFNVIGTKLVAVSNRNLYVLPFLTYMKQSGSGRQGQVDRVKLPAYMSAKVTCCIWWQTALNRDIVIIGTEKGEIVFMDVTDRRCILKRQVNGQITRLELVPDDRQHMTYLLISGRSSLQWRLLLDVLDHDLHLTLTQDQMAAQGYLFYGGKTYVKSILNARNSQSGMEKEFEAQRFTSLPISVTLKYQNAKGCHLLSAIDKVDNSLKIYDSSLEHNPLFIYSLPLWTEHVIYTDRLIFIALSRQHVQVLANQLSEKDSGTAAKGAHVLYRHSLEEDETVLHMTSMKFSTSWYVELVRASDDSQCKATNHTILDGCLLITNKRLIQFLPNISPEQLFLNWSVAPLLDVERLETLARVTNIDILNLYLKSAEYHLTNGNAEIALDYLSCSKCDELLKISMLYKHKHYELVIEISNEVLLTGQSQLSASVKADISNMVLVSYVNSTSARGELSTSSQLREFLLCNTLYSLDNAMTLLCEHGAISLLLLLSLSRKFVSAALEHVFNQGKITTEILHERITCREFVAALGTVLEGAIVRLLSPADFCTYLLVKEDIKPLELLCFTLRVQEVERESIRLLLHRYHPQSNFVQISIARYREHLETAAMQSYATVEQEVDDSNTHKPDDYISSIYLFYIKLLLVLMPTIPHRCLLKSNLLELGSNPAKPPEKKVNRTTELQCTKYGRPLCCSSTTAYSIQRNTLFTWGSKDKLDSLSVENRIKTSTPRIFELSMVSAADIKAVSCGEKHLMMLCSDGLYGSGSSTYGQVGAGGCQEYVHPVKVPITDCVDVVCGRYHTLAIDKHGSIHSWGWGLFGQLGHGFIDNELLPRKIDGLADVFVTSIAAGHCHSLALSLKGEVWAFGSNTFGQIDINRAPVKVSTPLLIELSSPARLISTKYFHNIAVLESGVVLRWGIHPFSLRRKLQSVTSSADKSASGEKSSVVDSMKGFTNINISSCNGSIVQVESGSSHSAILTDSGTVYVWVETQNHLINHIMCLPLRDVVYLAANSGFSIALSADGSLYSWGRNNYGQLGLALRSVRYVENPGEVRLAASYRRASTTDMYGTRVTEHVVCVNSTCSSPDSNTLGPEQSIADYDPLEMYRLSRADAFPLQQSLSLFISSSFYPAAIAILCSTFNWTEAFFYHLKCLLLCQGHLKDNYSNSVLEVMTFYLDKVGTEESSQSDIQTKVTQILYRVLQFWQAKHLSVRPELEQTLLHNLNLISPSLYQLLLGPSAGSKLAKTFNKSFSSPFLASLTRSYMSWMSRQSGLEDKTGAWNGLVKTLHDASVSRASSSISHFDIEKLRSDSDDPNIVLFTCGHHFTKDSLNNKALPSFENRVLNKIPISGAAILQRYKCGDFTSIACPQCVYGTVRALVS